MMRLARRASMLVAFYLLASVATAYAECAWVLWEQSVDLFPRAPTLETWTIFRTHESRVDCQADVAKLMHPNSAWRVSFEQLGEDKVIQKIKRPDGEVVMTKRALCVPGTLDPRAPKAK